MALKDWEKNKAVTNPLAWRLKKGIGKITINKYSDGDHEVLIYTSGSSPIITKTFDKKRALKYAKAYMRKH